MEEIKSAVSLALMLIALCLSLAYGTTVYWIEANFSAPRLVAADQNGTIASTLALAPRSLPQALSLSRATQRVVWTELAFVNAHVKFASASGLADSGVVVALQSCARGIAVDSTNGTIYWTTTNLSAGPGIFRANLDGTLAQQIGSFGASSGHTPFGIAIDEKTQTLYWADFASGAIEKAAVASVGTSSSIVSGLGGPVGVALDPDSGFVFWTDANAGRIGRSKADGSGAATIVTNCASPRYIAMDRVSRRIYWTEFGASRVRSSNPDGTDTLTVAHTTNPPCGIALAAEPSTLSQHGSVPAAPAAFAVSIENPNRFAGSLRLHYRLPRGSRVVVEVFDLQSRLVAALPAIVQGAGYYTQNLNVRVIGSGAYVVRFVAGNFARTAKYTIQK